MKYITIHCSNQEDSKVHKIGRLINHRLQKWDNLSEMDEIIHDRYLSR